MYTWICIRGVFVSRSTVSPFMEYYNYLIEYYFFCNNDATIYYELIEL